jgi:hypothetical protein
MQNPFPHPEKDFVLGSRPSIGNQRIINLARGFYFLFKVLILQKAAAVFFYTGISIRIYTF